VSKYFRGKGLGRQEPYQPISAAWLNGVAEAAEGETVAGAGVVEQTLDGRTIIRAVPRDGKLVLTPSGGIPVATYSGGTLTPGSATCTILDPTPTGWVLGSGTVTVYNCQTGATGAVSGNTVVQTKYIDGRLVVDVEPC
jgi:hypothetical protein